MTGSGGRGDFGSSPRDPASPPASGQAASGGPSSGQESSGQESSGQTSANPASADPAPAVQAPPELADFQVTQALPELAASSPDGSRQDRTGGKPGRSSEPGEAAGDDAGHATTKKKTSKKHSFWREFAILAVIVVVLALVIKTWMFQAFYIPSGSMQNTLAIGDRIVVNKLVYHFRGISRGDIVVFNGDGSWDPDPSPPSSNVLVRSWDDFESFVGLTHNNDIYIKRVIGLPGDHVVCCNAKGQITVNGVALSETSYLYPGNAPSADKFNIVVPPGRLWVMGDHRAISYDSRGHMGDPGGGTIPESAVLGRAFVIIWPLSQAGLLNIPATFEQPKLTASSASSAAASANSNALAAAVDGGVPVKEEGMALPLTLGFAGGVPLTVAQAIVRRRVSARRSRRRARQA
jgi:signal peptidase I